MRNFAIIEQFNLDWKHVVPRDFESFEMFITPDVSLLFKNITNGSAPFKIGAYLMEDASKIKQFMTEVMPARSQERIETSFKDEEISSFLTLEDAKGLHQIFEEEKFICKQLEVLYKGRPINVPELPEGDFHKVIEMLAKLKVVSTMDFEKQWKDFDDEIDELREDVARGLRKQSAEKRMKSVGMTKKAMFLKSAVGTGLMTVSGLLAAVGKNLASSKDIKKTIAGSLLGVASLVIGIAGKNTIMNVVEHVQKGLVMSYG